MAAVGLQLSTVVTVSVVLLDLYAIASAITRRVGVEATLAWIFAILALPGVGGIAYLMLAGPSIQRTSRRKRAAALSVRAAAAAGARAAPGTPAAADALTPAEIRAERVVDLTEASVAETTLVLH